MTKLDKENISQTFRNLDWSEKPQEQIKDNGNLTDSHGQNLGFGSASRGSATQNYFYPN